MSALCQTPPRLWKTAICAAAILNTWASYSSRMCRVPAKFLYIISNSTHLWKHLTEVSRLQWKGKFKMKAFSHSRSQCAPCKNQNQWMQLCVMRVSKSKDKEPGDLQYRISEWPCVGPPQNSPTDSWSNGCLSKISTSPNIAKLRLELVTFAITNNMRLVAVAPWYQPVPF